MAKYNFPPVDYWPDWLIDEIEDEYGLDYELLESSNDVPGLLVMYGIDLDYVANALDVDEKWTEKRRTD